MKVEFVNAEERGKVVLPISQFLFFICDERELVARTDEWGDGKGNWNAMGLFS